MFKGKTIVLGVSASISAYKAANLASMLKKQHADVHVIMTDNASKIIGAAAFESLTGNKCIIDTFDSSYEFNIAHVSLAEKADVMIVAPASADIIGKAASGIADDMLSTTLLSMTCPVLIAPAMNTAMYSNPVVRDNIEKLKNFGRIIIPPQSGYLACGAYGEGRLASEDVLFGYIEKYLSDRNDLSGKKVLVSAGPTRQDIDPVRFITNRSSGKMGYAVAKAASLRGACVTLVSGPVNINPPLFAKTVNVVSAEEMFDAVKLYASDSDIIIKAAAVADYTPANTSDHKIKKSDGELSLALKPTEDILKWLGNNKKKGQVICGFSMETHDLIKNSKEKLISKKIDIIAANSITKDNPGFAADTNHLVLIERDRINDLPIMSKADAADVLIDRLAEILTEKNLRGGI